MQSVKLISLDDNNVRVYKIAKSLKEKNYNVEIIMLERKKISNEVYHDEIINGISVKRFYCRKKENTDKYPSFLKKIIYVKWFFKFIKKVKKYLANIDCDFLICQANIGTFAGLKAKKKDIEVFYDMRELYEGRGKKISFFLKKFNLYLLKRVDNVIYLNDKQKEMIPFKYHYKLIYLPNYVEKSHYKNIKKSKSNYLRIGYIGCPRDTLSLTNLILSVKDNKNIKVFIHGMGSSYLKLKQLEKEVNNLEVTGSYNGLEDSEKLFNGIDLLFCGYDVSNINWKNAIAVKFFEGIITLTPMLVFKDSKMGELVLKNKIGFVIKNNTIKDFKEVINNISFHDIFEKQTNLKKIQYNYTWDKVIDNLLKKLNN